MKNKKRMIIQLMCGNEFCVLVNKQLSLALVVTQLAWVWAKVTQSAYQVMWLIAVFK